MRKYRLCKCGHEKEVHSKYYGCFGLDEEKNEPCECELFIFKEEVEKI